MQVDGVGYRTIWMERDDVFVIDQRLLPHVFTTLKLETVADVAMAIGDMAVRGAGLIGVTAAYGMYLAARAGARLTEAAALLTATRPTAKNLEWAVERCLRAVRDTDADPADVLRATAAEMADEDVAFCRRIGEHGVALIEAIAARRNGPVRILTHCNAGWLAFVDYGSATAPIYEAFDRGIEVMVWVDETRPRNQGASLTAWELGRHGVPYSIVTDNTGGHLMQHGMVDLVMVGADRVTRSGDAANKIGTYLKALAARDNGVPFYVVFPSSSFDWSIRDGLSGIPIEERSADEVLYVTGRDDEGRVRPVRIAPDDARATNMGFDVTPARLIDGLITERGICRAREDAILDLFPEHGGGA